MGNRGGTVMITRTIMTPEHQLIKLSPKQTLEEGLKIISDNSFLSLPVVEDKKFLGVLHAKNILEDLFLKRANEREQGDCFGYRLY